MRRWLALLLLAAIATPQEADTPPDLHKIYVPYKKLDEVFGKETERVMVPFKEFMELWKLKYGPKANADKPPVPFIVESAAYEGRVVDGVASFTAKIGIEIFAETWLKIPLAFSRVAFEEVTVDGEPGVLAPSKQGYDLLLRGKGRHEVEARFVAGIAKGKDYATSEFGLPSVPLHRLVFRVPGKDTEIKLEPARAHTVTNEGGETKLLAFLGPQKSVKLTWRFRPEATEQEPPLLFSTDIVDIRVEERVLRGRVQFDLQVLRTPARELEVRVPEHAQILEVTGKHIRTWGFPDEARRILRIELREPATGKYTLAVSFEAPVEVPGTLALPVFRIEKAAREHGFVRVASAEGVGLRKMSGKNVFQMDLNALPKQVRGGARALGYRFPTLPYALGLRLERINPRVTVSVRARLEAEKRRIRLNQELHFTVERAGIFTVRLEVPEGIILTKVGNEKLIDSWRDAVTEGKRIRTLNLRGRRLGKFVLAIAGEAPLDLAKGTLDVPLVRVLDVEREEGTLGVFMDPGIKAVAKTTGVVPLEPARLRREDRFRSRQPLAFAWRWRGHDAKVSFEVEARKPKVTCDLLYSLQAEEARVRVRVDLAYDVRYTGVEKFRFRVPKSIVEKLRVDGANIREKPHADDPVEAGKERTTAYTVTLQGPALGKLTLWVEYDDIFRQPLRANAQAAVVIPKIEPLDVERADTYVAVRKAPTIKVSVGEGEYEQIDPAELPPALRGDEVFLALRRFDHADPFRLELTKYEYEQVADLVVRHVHLKTVIADEGRATTTAFFEILNNDRQFLAVRLPGGNEVLDLRVAGRPEKPRLGANNVMLVPLETGLRKDASFEVAIAYTHPITTRGGLSSRTELDGPVLPASGENTAPFQALLTWSVNYPNGWRVGGFEGNVTPTDDDATRGSWFRRAIAGMGALIRPAEKKTRPRSTAVRPVAFKDIIPTPTRRDSQQTLFMNGTGDGKLVIAHTSTTARVLFTLLALALGIAATIFASRAQPLWRVGGGIALIALVFLTFAGPGWAAFWNGMLAGTVLASVGLLVSKRVKARKA